MSVAETESLYEATADASLMQDTLERIMTQHWDMIACRCWVCVEAREEGCRPREVFLRPEARRDTVTVPWPKTEGGDHG